MRHADYSDDPRIDDIDLDAAAATVYTPDHIRLRHGWSQHTYVNPDVERLSDAVRDLGRQLGMEPPHITYCHDGD